jgi:hypothetical protein
VVALLQNHPHEHLTTAVVGLYRGRDFFMEHLQLHKEYDYIIDAALIILQ